MHVTIIIMFLSLSILRVLSFLLWCARALTERSEKAEPPRMDTWRRLWQLLARLWRGEEGGGGGGH